ncbi:MAG: cbb3-type cytochrome c oxidase subunit I [Nitrospinota bacterium]|nr:cbb3-type cytochrome c oxidase subunit I [Nitrospinota bacterium]
MDKFGKLFVKASVIYLSLGALFGLHMAVADHGYTQLRFIHVHFMLIGFMAMMIFGVGYHILPRFNAKPLPYPALVPVHFWLANAGLMGMGALYVAGAFSETGAPRMLFGLFGLMEASGMFIFTANIYSVLTEEKRPEPFTVATAAQSGQAPKSVENAAMAQEVKLSPAMKISEILEKYLTWRKPWPRRD